MTIDVEPEAIRVLRLEPGDHLVATYPGVLSAEAADRLQERLSKEFPAPVTLLCNGITLSVVRSVEAEGPTA